MARRRKSKGGQKNDSGFSGNIGGWETCRGHHRMNVLCATSGAAQTVIEVHPRLLQSNRLAAYADIFENFRVKKLMFTFSSGDTAAVNGGAMAYVPGELIDAFPTTFDQMSEMDHMAFRWPQAFPLGVGTKLKLGAGILEGVQKYYSTTVTTDAPGSLVFSVIDINGVAILSNLFVRCDWEFEFYGRTDPAVTLSRLRETYEKAVEEDGDIVKVLKPESSKRTNSAHPVLSRLR
jgi:hypothetical protein